MKNLKKEFIAENLDLKEYNMTSHDLRATAATNLYIQGWSVGSIKEYMGHTSENIT
jgi:integrase